MAVVLLVSVVAVVVVNGWTDAPGALTTVVCSGALPRRRAVALVALANGVGASLAGLLLPRVASTMLRLADFPQLGGRASTLLFCLVLWVVSLWGTLAWVWGIPTSESHALLAALAGAALATGGGSLDLALWGQVGLGLLCSAGGAWLLGRWLLPRKRQPQNQTLGKKQILYCAGLALLHGAQDGQKYTAMLCAAGLGGGMGGQLGAVLLCASAMALGSSFGAGRIVEAIGGEMAPLDGHSALCTDRAPGWACRSAPAPLRFAPRPGRLPGWACWTAGFLGGCGRPGCSPFRSAWGWAGWGANLPIFWAEIHTHSRLNPFPFPYYNKSDPIQTTFCNGK